LLKINEQLEACGRVHARRHDMGRLSERGTSFGSKFDPKAIRELTILYWLSF